MFNSWSLGKIASVVLAGMICFGGSAFAAGSSDELLDLIPADSIFAVRLNNFDSTLGEFDTFLTGVSPMSMNMMVRMQLSQLLGSPELKGIDMGGNFGAYAIAKPGQMDPVIKVLVPVSNYAEFAGGNPNVGDPDANGISKVMMNGKEFAVVKKAGNYALFAQAGDLDKSSVVNGIGNSIDDAEMGLALNEPIWGYVNVQKVREVYGQVVVEQMNKIKTMMVDAKAKMEAGLARMEKSRAGMDVNDPDQQKRIKRLDKRIASMRENIKQLENNPMMENLGNVMDMYIRIVETLLKETKSFSLVIEPAADVLTTLETYTAMPGSDSAKVLVADTSGVKADKLINYLQNGAMMNLAGRLNKPLLQKFYGEGISLMGVMTGGEMSSEDVAKMKDMVTDIIDSLGGAVAVSMWADKTASPPFMEDCIIEVSDAVKFNNTVLKGIELWNTSGIMDIYKDMGMETNYVAQMAIYEYKGVKVNSAALKFNATDPNSQQAQIIEKMYGDGFEYRWAVVDGLCVEAIAGDVEAAVKQLIDEVEAGGAIEPASDIKLAMAMLGDGADDFFGTFNVVRMLKMMSAMPSAPVKNVTVESKSNIAFGGKVSDGKVVFKVAVPKTHVSEVMSVFMPKPQAK